MQPEVLSSSLEVIIFNVTANCQVDLHIRVCTLSFLWSMATGGKIFNVVQSRIDEISQLTEQAGGKSFLENHPEIQKLSSRWKELREKSGAPEVG